MPGISSRCASGSPVTAVMSHHVDPGRDLAALPTAHSLAGDVKLLGKLVLREVVREPYGDKFFCEGHEYSSRRGRFDNVSIRADTDISSNG